MVPWMVPGGAIYIIQCCVCSGGIDYVSYVCEWLLLCFDLCVLPL